MVIHGDFETRSTVELKEAGVHVYAEDPSTDVWCFAYAIGDQEPVIWMPGMDRPFLTTLVQQYPFVAHNAAFELAIWNAILVPRYGWPALKPANVRCAMCMAYAMALPGSLENAAAAVGLTQQKDAAGQRLAVQMSRPRTTDPLTWWDDFDRLQRLTDYCLQDVRTEQALYNRLLALSPAEQKLWTVDQRINDRGIYIDTSSVQKAMAVVTLEAERLNGAMWEATDGAVGAASEVVALTQWLKDHGAAIEGVAKADVLDALNDEDLPELCRRPLEIRREAGKTSTAKLRTLLNVVSPDHRARGLLQYHAAGTGRWGGRRFQPQNLPRPSIDHHTVESAIALLHRQTPQEWADYCNMFVGPPLTVISDCLRGMITAAPGHELLAADFANIEGRVLAWLSGELWKLRAFEAYDRKEGPDIYKLSYSKAFRIPVAEVTKDQRQVGKVQELALGYQGGVGAFQTMARGYGVKVSNARADEVKVAWREAHPSVVRFWYALENAAMDAVRRPGLKTWILPPNGQRIQYVVKGSFLFCMLPSGRVLTYPYPKLQPTTTPWGEEKEQLHYMSVDGKTRKWGPTHTYGGKLAENVTQAVSRDILAEAICRVEEQGYPVVLHVHDEIVSEVPLARNCYLDLFSAYVQQVPRWATGLPIAVEAWRGFRYRK